VVLETNPEVPTLADAQKKIRRLKETKTETALYEFKKQRATSTTYQQSNRTFPTNTTLLDKYNNTRHQMEGTTWEGTMERRGEISHGTLSCTQVLMRPMSPSINLTQ
jgi:hypothetical protein